MSVIYGYRYDEIHSELDAYRRIPRKFRNNLILLNYRFNKHGLLRISRPCPLCMPWCLEVFDGIYYSTSEGMMIHV